MGGGTRKADEEPAVDKEHPVQDKQVYQSAPNTYQVNEVDLASEVVQKSASISTESYLKYLRKLDGEIELAECEESEEEIETGPYGYWGWSYYQSDGIDYEVNLDEVTSDYYLD